MIDLFRFYLIAEQKRIIKWALLILALDLVIWGVIAVVEIENGFDSAIELFIQIHNYYYEGYQPNPFFAFAFVIPAIVFLGRMFRIFNDKYAFMIPASFAMKFVSRLVFCIVLITLVTFVDWNILICIVKLIGVLFLQSDAANSLTIGIGPVGALFHPFSLLIFSLSLLFGAMMDNSGFTLFICAFFHKLFPYSSSVEVTISFIALSCVLVLLSYYVFRNRNVVSGLNVPNIEEGGKE